MAPMRPVPYDRSAVTSLIVLGTCLAPIAVWFGVRGIIGTRNGERRGRWCAVVAVIGGVITTALMIGGIAGGERIRDLANDIDLSAGDCVDPLYDENGAGDLVDFDVRPCNEPHDAEVASSGHLSLSQIADYADASAAELCAPLIDARYDAPAQSGLFAVTLVTLGDPDEPTTSDVVYCLLTSDDGAPLSWPIGKGA